MRTNPSLKRGAALLVSSAAVLLATTARGAPTEDECVAAANSWAALKQSGKLRDAAGRLAVCASASCPSEVREVCSDRLKSVNAAIPSVVLEAKDGSGAPLVDVRVTMDGAPVAARLDGKALELDPGHHTFVFTTAMGTVKQEVLVKEGAKDVSVTATFPREREEPAAAPPIDSRRRDEPPKPTPSENSGSPLKTIGYVAGGLGIVGLGVGGFFGLRALGKKSDANCDANNKCDPAPLSDARSAATLSTVGFIAGGALLAGGVALVVFAPSGGSGVQAAPAIGARESGLVLRGFF
jgi:hypothetical protein